MTDLPRLLMAVSGIGLFIVGLRGRKKWEAGYGISIFGSALFGYFATQNDMYSWFQWPFVIAMVGLVLTRFVHKTRSTYGRKQS
jgi:hypothetical protein